MMTWQTQAEPPSQLPPAVERQDRPEQQPAVGEHAWPLTEQVDPGSHFPVVSPSRMLQVSPEQQSELEVHTPVCGWQAWGAWQTPPEQMLEQHCEPPEQDDPLGEHAPPPPPSGVPPSVGSVVPPSGKSPEVGTRQALVSSEVARHWVPGQHVTPPWSQRVPTGEQEGDWHVRNAPPSVAGRQSALLQHWSENWQMPPEPMQQLGSPV